LTRDQLITSRTDPTGYYKWLLTELRRVHDAVKIACEEVKKDDKVRYDKAHKVIEPTWKIGDTVLLQESTVRPGASKVITKQRFVGPYIIQYIVVGRPDVGPAYHLVDEKTGKPLRDLVSNDRLKKYNVNRQELNARLPRLTESRSQMQQPQNQQQTVMTKAQEPRPVEIMSDKKVAGKRQYRVKYTDGKIYLCDWVNRPLLNH